MPPPITEFEIRSEVDCDAGAIDAVLEAAFGQAGEANLVRSLRRNDHLTSSLVGLWKGELVGHIAFSPVKIEGEGRTDAGVGLAPVAVAPRCQSMGFGSELVLAGLAECRRMSALFVVVLGEPAFYERFGFTRASAIGIQNEYGVDREFMVLELKPGALQNVRGLARYAEEFRSPGT